MTMIFGLSDCVSLSQMSTLHDRALSDHHVFKPMQEYLHRIMFVSNPVLPEGLKVMIILYWFLSLPYLCRFFNPCTIK